MKKKTHEEFLIDFKKIFKDEYTVLGQYKNNKTPILIRHNICGYEYNKRPDLLLQNYRCPKCSKRKKKTTEEFKKEIFNLVNNEYDVIGEYVNTNKPILMKHIKCNNTFDMRPINFIRGNRCPFCAKILRRKNKTLTNDEFLKKLNDKFKDEYIPIENYKNMRTKIEFKHNKCGFIWNTRPNDILRGFGCPRCWESKGEKKVRKYLEKLNIPFKQQYVFKDLYDKSPSHPLRFDFRILTQDLNNYILIEFDGSFHKNNKYDKSDLEIQKKHDKMKDDYVMSHDNMCLYRIDYTEFDKIEECIDEILNENNII